MILKSIPFAFALCLALAIPRADELDYNSNDTASTLGAKPKTRLDAGAETAARNDLSGGSSLTGVGHAMAAGGLLLSILGNTAENGGLAIAGNLIYQLGVPLVGVGAGQVNRAAEKLNPAYRADYRGWGWYWTAFAMGTVGSITLNNALKKANEADTEEEQDAALEDAGFPALLVLGSGICAIVSWVKFGKLAGEGKRAAQEVSALRGPGQLEVLPTLAILADGSAAPGLHLGYRF